MIITIYVVFERMYSFFALCFSFLLLFVGIFTSKQRHIICKYNMVLTNLVL